MDLLGEMLLSIRIDANSIGVFHAQESWGVHFPSIKQPTGILYGVLNHPCWLLREGYESIPLSVGDFILVLRDTKIAIASSIKQPLTPFLDIWRKSGLPEELSSRSRREAPIHFGLDESLCNPKLVTVACVLHEPDRNQLLTGLPDVMVLPSQSSSSVMWSTPALEWLLNEDLSRKPGFLGPATLLASLLLTSFLRDYILLIHEGKSGFLAALKDSRIGKALTVIHSEPELDWSVETLAFEANMSRSNFSKRFKELIGQSPGYYLTATRIHQAACDMLESRVSITELSERYQYKSESAFRTAFKQHMKYGPTEYLKMKKSNRT